MRRLELTDFRSYQDVAVELEPGINVLVGPNGIGKTNLVEALGYVATLDSHRVATDIPLVRSGASAAVIRADLVHNGRTLRVELSIEPGRVNRARLSGAPVRRPRDVLGALALVLFAPEDVALVRGDPADRRQYLDTLLVTRQPRYAGVRADYERVLKQRNALLRTAYLARKVGSRQRDLSTLDAWDVQLAKHGAELLAGRLELCGALAPYVSAAYRAVAPDGGQADLVYRAGGLALTAPDAADGGAPSDAAAVPSADTLAGALSEALAKARDSEIERGVTLVGPHRDDLILTLGDLPAKGYASHGESWSLALALRLGAYRLLRAGGVDPVLVLDDVFAELDAGRRQRLADVVADASQLLVTCAVESDVPSSLGGARYELTAGPGGVEVQRVG